MKRLSSDTIKKFIEIVGYGEALEDQKSISPYLKEERNLYHGTSPLVLRPSCTKEISQILKLATETKTSITPQGGNTGLVGGQTPRSNKEDIILSLERMKNIRNIDLIGNTISVDAGINLRELRILAINHNRLFPLSLPSESSCQIGGNLATNAGGTAVLAYGNMRHLCLGLEVVLPTGEIWNGMRKLIKDNSNYDMRDLFIGSEGTLGIITGAVLKLFPFPKGKQVTLIAVNSLEKALQFLQLAKQIAYNTLTAFELISQAILELVIKHIPNNKLPTLENSHPWYVLMEISTTESEDQANQIANTILLQGSEKGMISEWTLSSSEKEKLAIWYLRNKIPLAQKKEGRSISHDISIPIEAIPSFLQKAEESVLSSFPGTRICPFGHMGDGNIHFIVFPPVDSNADEFLSRNRNTVCDLVYSMVLSYGGSIAAEHGIGQLHKERLEKISQSTELMMMQKIKNTFDPCGIMNPGKFI
ncbi:FAD-binding oxidoreductase [Candidatus Liberibacter sp.]|uniref:FAD-binding oxidoreductase n=1 Tax=Candidatus Liberibacter sp. TaxID=34022 RepID=UPI0015F3D7E5|nr:FAD-binding oxidoreductase [Candidatus Liberibacter sp.]MBA5724443.1 FAD-binding oxidoreductase [Candidatus Liberibacter sp.]